MLVMAETNYFKCACKECGNHIEFPASTTGTTVTCPHCGQWTELQLPQKPTAGKSFNPGMAAVIGCVVIAAGLAGWFYHWKTTSANESATAPMIKEVVKPAPEAGVARTNPEPAVVTQAVVEADTTPRPKSHADLKAGKIQLEKTPGNSLVYAVGTVKNDSAYQRFGVKIELDLFNRDGAKIDATQDYKDIIEPHQVWHFRALIPDTKTVSAKLAALTEQD
jgi:ribosomal protein S27E